MSSWSRGPFSSSCRVEYSSVENRPWRVTFMSPTGPLYYRSTQVVACPPLSVIRCNTQQPKVSKSRSSLEALLLTVISLVNLNSAIERFLLITLLLLFFFLMSVFPGLRALATRNPCQVPRLIQTRAGPALQCLLSLVPSLSFPWMLLMLSSFLFMIALVQQRWHHLQHRYIVTKTHKG